MNASELDHFLLTHFQFTSSQTVSELFETYFHAIANGSAHPSEVNMRLTRQDEDELSKILQQIRIKSSEALISSKYLRQRTQTRLKPFQSLLTMFRNQQDGEKPLKITDFKRLLVTPTKLQELQKRNGALHPTLLRCLLPSSPEELCRESSRAEVQFAQLAYEATQHLQHLIILAMMPFVKYYVYRYFGDFSRRLPNDDEIYTLGMFALQNAVEKFDAENGSFQSYSKTWIRKLVLEEIETSRLIPIRRHAKHQDEEISQLTRETQVVSIASHDEEDDDSVALFESNLPTPEEIVIEKRTAEILDTELDRVLKPRDASMIRERFGLSPFTDETSRVEIGKRYKFSKEYVRQCENKSLQRLRKLSAFA